MKSKIYFLFFFLISFRASCQEVSIRQVPSVDRYFAKGVLFDTVYVNFCDSFYILPFEIDTITLLENINTGRYMDPYEYPIKVFKYIYDENNVSKSGKILMWGKDKNRYVPFFLPSEWVEKGTNIFKLKIIKYRRTISANKSYGIIIGNVFYRSTSTKKLGG